MRRRAFMLIAVAVTVALGFWVWRILFPGPERAVRQRLLALARIASVPTSEGPLAQISNAQKAADFFAEDVLIQVDVGSGMMRSLSGREELLQTSLGVRRALAGLVVEFLDINVAIGPDKKSADVDLTAKIRVPTDRDMIVQELRITLKKKGREWLIRRVETVKTLAVGMESRLQPDPCSSDNAGPPP